MPYKAAAIANYFLDLAEKHGKPLQPMKVQKLVYFAHGWSLALNNESLIDEQVEAWKFGPVIRSLYHDLKQIGGDDITGRISKTRRDSSIAPGSGQFGLLRQLRNYTPAVGSDDGETRSFLDQVWDVYSDYTGIQMSNMTHYPDTPWSQVMAEHHGNPPRGTDIPRELIRAYFDKMDAGGFTCSGGQCRAIYEAIIRDLLKEIESLKSRKPTCSGGTSMVVTDHDPH